MLVENMVYKVDFIEQNQFIGTSQPLMILRIKDIRRSIMFLLRGGSLTNRLVLSNFMFVTRIAGNAEDRNSDMRFEVNVAFDVRSCVDNRVDYSEEALL